MDLWIFPVFSAVGHQGVLNCMILSIIGFHLLLSGTTRLAVVRLDDHLLIRGQPHDQPAFLNFLPDPQWIQGYRA
jgi:hypothetical protein